MKIELVVADAFGPLRDQTLALTPGFNVLFGPNEAGKSTWHAALIAALCGTRRGVGAATREAREFALRNRPWTGMEWSVSTVVVLENGRRIRLSQDLNDHVDCQAIEVAFGRDVSDEIIFEGAPDGSRYLGLDRRAFASTACVRQADLDSVRNDAQALQVHIQRAAAARGSDSTAASALNLIDNFKREHVGLERANSNKPLQSAITQVARGRTNLDRANETHQDRIRRERLATGAREEADRLREQLRELEAASERRELTKLQRDLERATELSRQVPEKPRDPDGGPPLDEARAALAAWKVAPGPRDLAGDTAAELAEQLRVLPKTSIADEEADPIVVQARRAYDEATQRLRMHDERQVPSDEETLPANVSGSELRSMATVLQEPRPQIADEELGARRAELAAAASRAQGGKLPLAVGAAVCVLTGIALSFLVPIIGVALIAAGVGLGVAWGIFSNRHAKAEGELRSVEGEIGTTGYAEREWKARRAPVVDRLEEVGLPAQPADLLALADRHDAARQTQIAYQEWATQRERLTADAQQAAAELETALDERGAPSGPIPTDRLERYLADCDVVRTRRRLSHDLEARRTLEASASTRESARDRLYAAAGACGLNPDLPTDQLTTDLGEWVSDQDQATREAGEAKAAWAELQALLRGTTLEEMSQRVSDIRERLGADSLEGPPGIENANELDDAIEETARQVREAAEQAAELEGQLRQFLASAPSVAEAEEELRAAQGRLEQVKTLEETLDATARFLGQAQDEVHRDIAPVLVATINAYLSRITAGRYSEAAVDPRSLQVRVQDEDGQFRDASRLSHGTAEQIYLLLRVALAEHLTAPGESCPLILDEVTVQSDTTRTRAMLEILLDLSIERQIILFTQEDHVRDWAEDNLQSGVDSVQYLVP